MKRPSIGADERVGRDLSVVQCCLGGQKAGKNTSSQASVRRPSKPAPCVRAQADERWQASRAATEAVSLSALVPSSDMQAGLGAHLGEPLPLCRRWLIGDAARAAVQGRQAAVLEAGFLSAEPALSGGARCLEHRGSKAFLSRMRLVSLSRATSAWNTRPQGGWRLLTHLRNSNCMVANGHLDLAKHTIRLQAVARKWVAALGQPRCEASSLLEGPMAAEGSTRQVFF